MILGLKTLLHLADTGEKVRPFSVHRGAKLPAYLKRAAIGFGRALV